MLGNRKNVRTIPFFLCFCSLIWIKNLCMEVNFPLKRCGQGNWVCFQLDVPEISREMLRFLINILPFSRLQHLLLNQRMHLLWNRAQKQKTATDLSSVEWSLYYFSMGKARLFLCFANRSWFSHKINVPFPKSPSPGITFLALVVWPSPSPLPPFSSSIPGCNPHFSVPIISHIFAPCGRE